MKHLKDVYAGLHFYFYQQQAVAGLRSSNLYMAPVVDGKEDGASAKPSKSNLMPMRTDVPNEFAKVSTYHAVLPQIRDAKACFRAIKRLSAWDRDVLFAAFYEAPGRFSAGIRSRSKIKPLVGVDHDATALICLIAEKNPFTADDVSKTEWEEYRGQAREEFIRVLKVVRDLTEKEEN